MSDAAVSVLSDTACRLGEGPAYDAHTDTLFWFDILERKLLELPLSGGKEQVHDLPVMASALARVDEARQLLVTETGLQLRDRASGALEMLAEVEADRPDTRSNDARPHPAGALWFGTMGKSGQEQTGAIYWFFKGEVRRLFSHITIPNSICFSPDGAIGYFADTRENRLYRVACDPETGLPVDDPVLTVEGNEMPGGIDGSVMDADGTLWNARWGAGRLDAWTARGELIRSIQLPARQVTCPVFIGRNADRLAVTSAFEDMDEAARKADPQAGKTFVLDLAVNGRLDPPVLL
ncbi:SMP-30/gluconolactonase/LRE family protein [Chelativorans salis]|uniref:SMP-30/gluconolactonase/LRE family protein n=1 Tax=Chelativorans salis TaxID=2978478 RepID=A0ABT2LVL4_9HYPH|nr:SMP-30/gluconolactonase/LRE family protein [Chelativorans sp. EGI FJ00035]MCT7378560.1 SMP-30/gluconolactonase/LRE family protein [Chelativorans sp. EGI FJ00035]